MSLFNKLKQPMADRNLDDYLTLLHEDLFRKNSQQFPVNFLTTFLLYLVAAGLIIFQRREVPFEEYYIAGFWTFCFLILLLASRPLMRGYLK